MANRVWYERNHESILARQRLWKKNNPLKVNALNMNRRAQRRLAFVEHVDHAVVFERDGGVCQICQNPIGDAKWHIDHVMPLVAGGEHSYANVQLSHAKCNMEKGAKIPIVELSLILRGLDRGS